MTPELLTPPIGTTTSCRTCGRDVVWDEVYGWLHLAGQQNDAHAHHANADWNRP